MKAAVFLISLTGLLLALPAHAKDSDDLSSWSLEELCEKKDKSRHADAVLAEIARRGTFKALELELIREGQIDIGIGEAALRCSWGLPHSTEVWNGDRWQVYYQRRNGQQRRLLLRIDSSFVAEIRSYTGTVPVDPALSSVSSGLDGKYDTFSGRWISPLDGSVSEVSPCLRCIQF